MEPTPSGEHGHFVAMNPPAEMIKTVLWQPSTLGLLGNLWPCSLEAYHRENPEREVWFVTYKIVDGVLHCRHRQHQDQGNDCGEPGQRGDLRDELQEADGEGAFQQSLAAEPEPLWPLSGIVGTSSKSPAMQLPSRHVDSTPWTHLAPPTPGLCRVPQYSLEVKKKLVPRSFG